MMKKVIFDFVIYTDGACLGNPGPGGWGAIIISKNDSKKIIKGGTKNTTNNRMELMAVIEALDEIKENCKIKIFTDSKYVINGIESWIENWKKNNWVTSNKKKVKNVDLWTKLDNVRVGKIISWEWVKGHSGIELNEEVDILAKKQAMSLDVL